VAFRRGGKIACTTDSVGSIMVRGEIIGHRRDALSKSAKSLSSSALNLGPRLPSLVCCSFGLSAVIPGVLAGFATDTFNRCQKAQ